ncbi:hypothetical protein [Streptomyces sp. NPDC006012]|uniref:hypothetical protein n=1 Tax=Streptomyces sp. NPDC006012 TaxID=3364739 RepID=UPI00369DBBE9
MVNDTTLLLGLDGVSVVRVESLADGTRRAHLITADEAVAGLPVLRGLRLPGEGTGGDPAA